MKDGTLKDDVFIWETEHGDIAAVLNREAPGSVFLQIHPSFRTAELESEMLSVAEQHLAVSVSGNSRHLHVWAEREDEGLKDALRQRGYALSCKRRPEHQRRRILAEPILSAPPAEGYSIRSLGDIDEHHARCWVSRQAFHPTEPKERFEAGWYHNVQRAPLYRRDLDLVAVAPAGDLAAFCTIWFDDVTRTGLFEPVGTAPQHQRKGLAKAVLLEGLKRLRDYGAELAYVGSYNETTHAVYESVGFRTHRILEPWDLEVPL